MVNIIFLGPAAATKTIAIVKATTASKIYSL